MELGLIALPNVADVELAAYAEQLGYSSFYVGENSLMWSDSLITLALAAERTERIKLVSGVSIAGYRGPTVLAQSMGTLNLLAPGRVRCGVGTGNSAMRVLGHDPMRVAEYEDYVRTVRPLLSGDEATLRWRGRERIVRHVMPPERGCVRFEPPVPLYVSGFGPRTMALAGRYGDGIIAYLGATAEEIESTWEPIERGAAEAGREIDRSSFFSATMLMILVLRPGETADSSRIRDLAGPVAMLSVHYSYEQYKQLGTPPPSYMDDFWDDYVDLMERVPVERRGMRIHEGHGQWVPEEDEQFVTRDLIEGTCIVGSGEEIAAKLRSLEAANLTEVAINPSPDTAREVIEDIAEHVMPLLAADGRAAVACHDDPAPTTRPG